MGAHFCPDLIKIQALDNYHVICDFADGSHKICDLSDHLDKGVFKIFRDINFFKKVHAQNGAAIWDENIDIAPEYLYEHGQDIKK